MKVFSKKTKVSKEVKSFLLAKTTISKVDSLTDSTQLIMIFTKSKVSWEKVLVFKKLERMLLL